MYVWEVRFQERWSYMKKGEWSEDSELFRVSARSYDEAIEKAKKAALSPTRNFEDDEKEGVVYSCIEVRLTSIEQGDELDA